LLRAGAAEGAVVRGKCYVRGGGAVLVALYLLAELGWNRLARIEDYVRCNDGLVLARGQQDLVVGTKREAANEAGGLEAADLFGIGEGVETNDAFRAAGGDQDVVLGDGDGVERSIRAGEGAFVRAVAEVPELGRLIVRC